MQIYLILYFFIITLCFFEMKIDTIKISKDIRKSMKDVSFIVIFLFILVLGILRSESMGVDYENYRIYYFEPYSTMPFFKVFTYDSDFGFGIVTWIIAKLTKNYWVFRSVLFIFVFISISMWIKKYSKCVSLSYLIYVSMGCMHNDFFILRLSLAVSISAWSYRYLIERKMIRFLVVVLLASTCHKSALFMLILYPIMGEKYKQLKSLVRANLLIIFILIAKYGGMILVQLYRRNDYSADVGGGQGYGLLLFYCVIFAITLFFSRFRENGFKDQTKGLMLGILYPQILATSVSIVTRVVYYALTYQYMILPNVAKNCRRKNGDLYVLAMVIILSVMFFYSTYPTDYFTHFSS